jgi:hypothetical protein
MAVSNARDVVDSFDKIEFLVHVTRRVADSVTEVCPSVRELIRDGCTDADDVRSSDSISSRRHRRFRFGRGSPQRKFWGTQSPDRQLPYFRSFDGHCQRSSTFFPGVS